MSLDEKYAIQYEDKIQASDYDMANAAQSACNLSGIVFTFAKAMQKVCDDSNRRKEGTEWKNHHPISVLYAHQIAFLSGAGNGLGEPGSVTSAMLYADKIIEAAK